MKTVTVTGISLFTVIARSAATKQSSLPCGGHGLLRFARDDGAKLRVREYPLDCRECFGYHRSMKAGPDIAMVASLVGDPARSNMLTALMTGRALTASELAQEAGITPQTASSHLAKLEGGGLIVPEKQGRHRYYRLTGPDVAGVLEGLAGLAARAGHMRVRTGPKDPALRRARICYDHLAGDLGVQMLDSLKKQRLVRHSKQAIELTAEGKRFMARSLQID